MGPWRGSLAGGLIGLALAVLLWLWLASSERGPGSMAPAAGSLPGEPAPARAPLVAPGPAADPDAGPARPPDPERVALGAPTAGHGDLRVHVLPPPGLDPHGPIPASWLRLVLRDPERGTERRLDLGQRFLYEFARVEAERPLRLEVRNPWGPALALDVPPLRPDEVRELRVACQAWFAAEGRVLDENDRPLSGAVLRLQDVSSPADGPTKTSGEDGSFRFTQLPPGSYWLSASSPGLLPPSPLRLEVPASELVLRFGRGLFLSGSVRWPDGEPALNQGVVARQEGTLPSTAGQGDRFEVHGLAPGEVELEARAHRDTTWGLVHARALPGESVELVLEEYPALEGEVVDEHGAPLEDFRVLCTGPSEPWVRRWGSTFSVLQMDPGEWTLVVSAPGRDLFRRTLRSPEDLHRPLHVVLLPGPLVSGQVLDPEGRPRPRARVHAWQPVQGSAIPAGELVFTSEEPWEFRPYWGSEPGRSLWLLTDDAGRFELQPFSGPLVLLAGDGEVRGEGEVRHAPSPPLELETRAGQRVEGLELRLRTSCSLSVSVLDAAGRRISTLLRLGETGGPGRTFLPGEELFMSSASEELEIDHLPPGPMTVSLAVHPLQSGPGLRPASATVELVPGRTARLELRALPED